MLLQYTGATSGDVSYTMADTTVYSFLESNDYKTSVAENHAPILLALGVFLSIEE